ncbi:hypothetical protein acdb102_21610 [Acidothermaceae bacterium B102]|nr:hypothetical protein acdb102_21610 [Acidothermaceae bacterium B102]
MAGDEAAWLLPGGVALLATAGGAAEAGGAVASETSGHGWRVVPFTFASGVTLIQSGTRTLWPGVDPQLIASLSVAIGAVVLLPTGFLVVRWLLQRPPHDSPYRSLAKLRDVQPFTPYQAGLRAQHLRPSIAMVKPKRLAPGDRGYLLGRLAPRNKTPLYGSWEDVALALMAPRSGKTSALAIPTILDAPGAVVATANKADVWQATAALRGQLTGERVWSFDPQRIVGVRQTWWWNPLRGVVEGPDPLEEAERLAGHFVLTVEDSRSRDIWGPAASGLLSALILAAAIDGRSLLDVYRWLTVDGAPTPVDLLTGHGWTAAAASLSGLYSDPPETRGSVYFTARTATRCLGNPIITAWITPPRAETDLDEFEPRALPATRQTLYLMSKDGGGAAGPLVAALTDAVMRTGVVAAEGRGGRLDPPLLVVLDEAANICRIADLPRLYSHLGSRGVVVLTILQSYSQGVTVWGDNGMKELWSAATIKLIGAGMDDSKFADEISVLVGDHDVRHVSRNTGGERATRTTSTRTQRILPPSAVRAMPKGSALLMATGVRIAPITLQTWFTGPWQADIAAAIAGSSPPVASPNKDEAAA